MKKICIFLILITMAIPVHAATMCVTNDTVAIVLDPSLSVTNNDKNNSMGTWWAWNAQGTVYGISACLNSGHGKSRGGTVARLTDTDGNGNTKLVTGSEKYGSYCWCRLTHPVSSLWGFYGDFGSVSDCSSFCADRCGGLGFRTYQSFRVGLIGSVE